METLPAIAEGRKAAGFKAPDAREAALAVFERAAASDMPDWHAAALALRAALVRSPAEPAAKPRAIRQHAPKALPPPPGLADYDVDRVKLRTKSPVLLVEYADGHKSRIHCPSKDRKPLNVGRALRVAVAFYRANLDVQKRFFIRGYTRALPVPEFVSVTCEATGETFPPELCNQATAEERRSNNPRGLAQHVARVKESIERTGEIEPPVSVS